MTSEDLVRGVVRIWSEGDTPAIVGTGVMVAPGLVLTCAHVVARAWGEASDFEEGLDRAVRIDLPTKAPGVWRDAVVTHWLPRRPAPGGAYDLAGLRFTPGHDDVGAPLPLVVDDAPWGKTCRVFGFPAGRPDGSYASGVLRDVLANGWTLVKGGPEAREFTRPGFSGGPVVTDAGVVGLLTEGDADVRVREAVMIPVRTILAAWPELHRRLGRSPYPGLAAFTAADAAYFRGRADAADEITSALAAPPHLVVLTGPSGSGKSSLLAAGVVPRLVAPSGVGATPWRPLVWTPGPAPFPAFARALLRAEHPGVDPVRLSVEAARLASDLDSGRV
ncbi:MAG: serine protease, partial [Trueperaceae bacterium]|nr:serine protease [Trueperaceae bacterium]